MLNLLEHTAALEISETAIDRLLAFEEPLLRVDPGPKSLEGLPGLDEPFIGLLGQRWNGVFRGCRGRVVGGGSRGVDGRLDAFDPI